MFSVPKNTIGPVSTTNGVSGSGKSTTATVYRKWINGYIKTLILPNLNSQQRKSSGLFDVFRTKQFTNSPIMFIVFIDFIGTRLPRPTGSVYLVMQLKYESTRMCIASPIRTMRGRRQLSRPLYASFRHIIIVFIFDLNHMPSHMQYAEIVFVNFINVIAHGTASVGQVDDSLTDIVDTVGGPGNGSPIGLSAAYHRGLVGCIRHVRLNKQRLHLVDDLFQDSVNNSSISFCAS